MIDGPSTVLRDLSTDIFWFGRNHSCNFLGCEIKGKVLKKL
jgi:hypothetical protein